MDYGSHISTAAVSQPSLLEVTAQQSMLDTLLPAWLHLINVVGDAVPSVRGVVNNIGAELFVLGHGLLQRYSLLKNGASLSEHFYDLKRVNLELLSTKIRIEDSSKSINGRSSVGFFSTASLVLFVHRVFECALPDRASHCRSLAVIVLLPYLQHKLNLAYQRMLDREDAAVFNTRSPSEDNPSRVRQLGDCALRCWPHLYLLGGMLNLLYYVRYLIGRSQVCSLQHALSGVTLLRNMSEEGELDKNQNDKFGLMARLADYGPQLLLETVEVGGFLLHFLDRFYSGRGGGLEAGLEDQLFSDDCDFPPFPHQPPSDGSTLVTTKATDANEGRCPYCSKAWRQPTALAVSGYVFCYKCVLTYVRKYGCCPVTKYPATEEQLIKVYHE